MRILIWCVIFSRWIQFLLITQIFKFYNYLNIQWCFSIRTVLLIICFAVFQFSSEPKKSSPWTVTLSWRRMTNCSPNVISHIYITSYDYLKESKIYVVIFLQRCYLPFLSMPASEYILGGLLSVQFATNFRVTIPN